MTDMSQIKVQKRDGRIEPFMREKLLNGMIKAGATQDQANSVADQIESWALGAAQNGVIKTSDIRTKLLELLRTVNAQAAMAFESYIKPTPPEQLVAGPTQPTMPSMSPTSEPTQPAPPQEPPVPPQPSTQPPIGSQPIQPGQPVQ